MPAPTCHRPRRAAHLAATPWFAALALGVAIARATGEPEIVPTAVLPIDGPAHFQPSGLALVQGELFTVSDKHDTAVFRLERQATRAVAVEALPIGLPGKTPVLDLEGIVADGQGGFFLVSEAQCRILHVPREGAATWKTEDLRPIGASEGMLTGHNAAFEGLARLGPRHFLLAVERDPRGLLEVDLTGPAPRFTIQRMATTRFAAPAGRGPDFADLALWQGRVFALLRNASAVCELQRTGNPAAPWSESAAAATFAASERDPRSAYRVKTYGVAEGLALDDTHLFVVLDNNDDALEADPQDRRARLLVFANPFSHPPAPSAAKAR